MNNLKTFVLMMVLMGLLVVAGYFISGSMMGVYVALGFSLLMNFGVYWFSDRIALRRLKGGTVAKMLSSHPPIQERVSRLRQTRPY